MSSTPAGAALPSRRAGRSPEAIAAAALASLVVIVATAAELGTGDEGLRHINRYLARLSFALFLLPFLASPLRSFVGGEALRGLVRERRAAGLAFATAHWIHAGAIGVLFATSESAAPDAGAAVGALGFVASGAMAATSNDAAVRRLGGARWRRLHRVGLWTIWAIFTVSYGGRVAAGQAFFAPFLALCLGGAGLRALAHRRRRAAGPGPELRT